MSLDFNLTKIKNFKKVCFKRKKINPKTESIIWATMIVDIGRITEENYDDFYIRLCVYSRLFGGFETITLKDVVEHIGLSTNVITRPRPYFWKRVHKNADSEIREAMGEE